VTAKPRWGHFEHKPVTDTLRSKLHELRNARGSAIFDSLEAHDQALWNAWHCARKDSLMPTRYYREVNRSRRDGQAEPD
jgi:hypothetical protein